MRSLEEAESQTSAVMVARDWGRVVVSSAE